MPAWRATMALLVVWTVVMGAWLLLYRGADATCGPEIYRNCQIGLKVITGLGRPGIVLLWLLGAVALAMTWLTTRRPRPEAVPRAAARRAGTSAASVGAGSNRVRRPANARVGATLEGRVVGQRFRESDDLQLLEQYVDSEGLVAGYRVERLLYRDPWRHTTYEASTRDGRAVALKLLHPRVGETRRAAKRFQHRVLQRASIEHPNLLPIVDWGKLGDQYYLATVLCQEPTLAELLKTGGLNVNGCLRLLGQLADALETAHERGLVHCELAPENVFVAPRGGGHVLLGDFGVADPEWRTGLLDLSETAAYLPPEKVRDEPLTPESNVYSLACILVECLTGSPPYASEYPGVVAYAHTAEAPPRISERRSELPGAIDELVAAAMAQDPDKRLGSARRLVATAAESLGVEAPAPLVHDAHQTSRPESVAGDGSSADGALAPSARGAPKLSARRHHRNVVALALAIGAAAAGVLGFTVARSTDDGSPTGRSNRVDSARLEAHRERTAALRATGVALERLDARRASARVRLAAARTRPAQVAVTVRLVKAYGAAARAVPTGFRDTARIASTLTDARQAYRRLGAAARRGSRRSYAIAGRAVRRRERDLQQAIARLN